MTFTTPPFVLSLQTKLLAPLALGVLTTSLSAQAPSLQVTYGNKGIQTLSFAGVKLEDTSAFGADTFHIWHMKSTDLKGNTIPGWGENSLSQSWNAGAKTETYTFSWGSICTQFVQQGNTLNMVVTEQNNAGSGTNFDGAEIYPFALHFPQDPAGFYGYTQQSITTTGPGVSAADFGSGVVTNVLPDETIPMYVGWKNLGTNTYSPMFTTTAPNGLAAFLPQNDRPVAPGSSFTFTISLRFTAKGTPINAADAYASFATQYPSQLNWTDRRILGTAYLASSPPATGNGTQPGGFPTNPRRYFNDPSVDVTTTAGLAAFQKRMLAQAAALVANTQALNGQGVITWDIEGEQYPQSTSYVCSPDQVAALAPEMESVISDTSSAYYGQKLDDAYFKTLSSARLKVGLCLRPQVFTQTPNGSASQVFLTTNTSIIANLENKARVANSRWGATIFYVDSTVDANGGTLDPAIFQQLITDFPGFLFIPEESTPRYYAYSAPFYSFIFHNTVGTPAEIYQMYPHAFGANLVNDVAAPTLATYQTQLTQAVVGGDILMGHADYWQANNPTLVAIYKAAGVGPKVTGNPVTPALNWSAPAGIAYGTPLSSAQLDASSSTLGSFVYSPAAGSVLPAGTNPLLVTFNPVDTVNYQSVSASVPITVAPATPAITWTAPATIAVGTALSVTQLNATASVPGAFTYTPAAGAVLPVGTTSLRASFVPLDSADYQPAVALVPLTVSAVVPSAPLLSWTSPAPTVYGTTLGAAQLNATANVAGSFAYTPAAGSVLPAGINILHASFSPGNTAQYSVGTATVSLNVQKATPTISWSSPAPISYGTLLSASQLNATANVAGSFSYSPFLGAALAAGTQTLTASFQPTDSSNYASGSATNLLTVTSPASSAPVGNLVILSPSANAVVAGQVTINARCMINLDPAGSYLMVDGVQIGQHRVMSGPFVYPLDTTSLTDGPHVLQLWAHDIGNNVTLSPPVSIQVAN